jgi:hypothetical protein
MTEAPTTVLRQRSPLPQRGGLPSRDPGVRAKRVLRAALPCQREEVRSGRLAAASDPEQLGLCWTATQSRTTRAALQWVARGRGAQKPEGVVELASLVGARAGLRRRLSPQDQNRPEEGGSPARPLVVWGVPGAERRASAPGSHPASLRAPSKPSIWTLSAPPPAQPKPRYRRAPPAALPRAVDCARAAPRLTLCTLPVALARVPGAPRSTYQASSRAQQRNAVDQVSLPTSPSTSSAERRCWTTFWLREPQPAAPLPQALRSLLPVLRREGGAARRGLRYRCTARQNGALVALVSLCASGAPRLQSAPALRRSTAAPIRKRIVQPAFHHAGAAVQHHRIRLGIAGQGLR